MMIDLGPDYMRGPEMIFDKSQLNNILTLLCALRRYSIRKAFARKDEVGIKDNSGIRAEEITMSDEEQGLYDKYSNIYINAFIFLHRGFSDETLRSRIKLYEHYGESASIVNKFMLKAAKIEMARRVEKREMEDIYIDIPFYLQTNFDWRRFKRTLTKDEEDELFALVSFLTNKAKSEDGLDKQEASIYENIMCLLHKCTGLSTRQIQSRVNLPKSSAQK